jgi:hypothetical protein
MQKPGYLPRTGDWSIGGHQPLTAPDINEASWRSTMIVFQEKVRKQVLDFTDISNVSDILCISKTQTVPV